MKTIKLNDHKQLDQVPGRRLGAGERFSFRCHPGVACFNRCCRNLNLFLQPYDAMRLKNCLRISSDAFIDAHVDVVLREGAHFPEVLLRMADDVEKTCPFLTDAGCSVYAHRPDTCRTFPVEHGLWHDDRSGRPEPVYYFRPPDFCLGQHEDQQLTIEAWIEDQQAGAYHRMTRRWGAVRKLFAQNPWGSEGPDGPRAKMAFMAAYNIDRFKAFVFESSFLRRYKIKSALLKKVQRDDEALLMLGFEWIRFFVGGLPSKQIRLRR